MNSIPEVLVLLNAAIGFRPQQGLSIMNGGKVFTSEDVEVARFPSPTGVKYYEFIETFVDEIVKLFPSPTGVKYYESVSENDGKKQYFTRFPSPTGVKYYESVQKAVRINGKEFPSPTGVKYYEL